MKSLFRLVNCLRVRLGANPHRMVQLLAFALLAALDQPEKVFFRDKHTSFFAGASLTKNIRFITLTPGCPTKFFDVK
jgi:hypothetical protein